jgi:hypothetical protein
MSVSKEEDVRHSERFRDALQKMSQVSLAYQQSQIKHMDYAQKIDAIIDASGWSREAFQAEVDRRKKNLSQK